MTIAGNVAIQQALILHFGLSYRRAAALTHVHPRTAWQHVAAGNGANVAAWDQRSAQVRDAAISKAAELLTA